MCKYANVPMKYNNSSLLFLFLTVLVTISSCSEKKLSDVIIGEWKVESVAFPGVDLAPSLLQDFEKEMLSTVYIFKEKGKFELRSDLISEGAQGTWRVNDEKNEIYIEYTAGGNLFKSTYQAEIIDGDKIKISQALGGDLGKLEAVLVRK